MAPFRLDLLRHHLTTGVTKVWRQPRFTIQSSYFIKISTKGGALNIRMIFDLMEELSTAKLFQS